MSDIIKMFPTLPPSVQEAILNGPAMPPPDGVTPNFDNPPNRNTEAIAFLTVCAALVFVFTVLRTYSKLSVSKKPGLDDLFGLLSLIAYGACTWDYIEFADKAGFFVHQYNIRLGELQKIVPLAVYLSITYGLVMLFSKTAILLEWIRIFAPMGTRNFFWWTCMIAIALNTILYTVSVILEAVACIPLEALWKPWLNAKCFDKKALDLTCCYCNLAIDLLILLLPQKVIWKLKMTLSKKIGVSIIFSFGLLTIVCAVGKVWSVSHVQYVGSYPGDLVYSIAPAYYWAVAENTCVMIVFCMPAIPKAFKDNWLGSRLLTSLRSWSLMRSTRRNVSNERDNQFEESSKYKSRSSNSDNGSESGLTELQSIHVHSSSQFDDKHAGAVHSQAGGIVRHTKISVHESVSHAAKNMPSGKMNYSWSRE